MNKREYLIAWLEKEGCLTSWHMHPGVYKWHELFYGNKTEKQAIKALLYYINKLVKEKVVGKRNAVGLGEGSKIEYMGHRIQYIWDKIK